MESLHVQTYRRKLPRWFLPTLGYVLSLVCLIWVYKGYNFAEIWEHFRSLDWKWVILGVLINLAVYVCQAWRWNTLLAPVEKLSLWESAQAIYIGLFASGVLPLRPGEIIRCYLVAHWNELFFSLVLTSAAIERVMDGLWMLAASLFTSQIVSLPRSLIDALKVFAVGLMFLTALFLYILFHKTGAHSVMSGNRWGRKFVYVIEEIHQMGNWRTLSAAFGISFLYLALEVVPVWALMKADGMDLSIWAAAAVLTIQRLGTLVPNAPGNVGSFQFFVVLALGMFGVEKATAVSLSVILFAAMTFPPLIIGAVAVALTGLKIGEIHHHAHHAHHGVKASRTQPRD